MTWIATALLLTCLQADPGPLAGLPRSLSLQEPKDEPFPRSEAQPAAAAKSAPLLDLDWLEITPSIGISTFSSDYLTDPAAALVLQARAPIPWLSPASDPKGEYFGAFLEAAFTTIDRDMSPSVAHRKGTAAFISFGLDYSLVRDDTWIVMARAGGLYAYYGNIADLESGFGFMVGASAGLQLSSRLGLLYIPELLLGKSGTYAFLNSLGLSIQF